MMWIEHEDFERAKELDEMFLKEKEQEMYAEWQLYNEQYEKERLPARIEILSKPKKQKYEHKTHTFPF